MKNIYHTLGLLIIAISFLGNIEAAHHEDALLDAVNNSDRNPKYSARNETHYACFRIICWRRLVH